MRFCLRVRIPYLAMEPPRVPYGVYNPALGRIGHRRLSCFFRRPVHPLIAWHATVRVDKLDVDVVTLFSDGIQKDPASCFER